MTMLSRLTSTLNRLLPFASPGTPLLQDVVHLAVLCGVLYYAPQLQDFYRNCLAREAHTPPRDVTAGIHARAGTDANGTTSRGQGRDELEARNPGVERVVEEDGGTAGRTRGQDPIEGDVGEGRDNLAVPPGLAADGVALEPGPGPADGPAITDMNRQVGAKKAKSLARRDQRRAYNEFLRSQGEARRAQDEAGRQDREAAAVEERARRAEIEAELKEKAGAEREARRNREVQEREDERRRREMVVSMVREAVKDRGYANLDAVAGHVRRDTSWVVSLIRASGLLTESCGEQVTFITEGNCVVKVCRLDLERAFGILEEGSDLVDGHDTPGLFSHAELGRVLEGILLYGH